MAQIATEQAPNRGRRPWYGQLYVQVLVAILAGALIGYFQPGLAVQLKPLGDVFIKLVKMVIGPVIDEGFYRLDRCVNRLRAKQRRQSAGEKSGQSPQWQQAAML
jgi:hypothetical protein